MTPHATAQTCYIGGAAFPKKRPSSRWWRHQQSRSPQPTKTSSGSTLNASTAQHSKISFTKKAAWKHSTAQSRTPSLRSILVAFAQGMARSSNKQGSKAYVSSPAWRGKLDTVVDLLRAIRSRYDLAQKDGTLHVGHDDGQRQWYCINDQCLAKWMDETRMQAVSIIGEICQEANITPPHSPRHRPAHW